ncbi:LytR/AlgR family response regulator transcription factor [Algoriphagus vanfongensis]|uniref:LytR/AlgR family response regulator transcription factor n=1 Tax=Algoriphagus vanfongensis TaxID=426371 RepID=UPI0004067F9C|nr:LytTR family DNA-binding domain-containing protein [Algoriphagus vanfongensis]
MDDKLKIGLIDDEQSALNKLIDLIAQFDDFEVGYATSDAHEGLVRAMNNEVNILITDIMMPGMGGLEITERLKPTGIPIIFCSAYNEFAVSGYEQDAAYFILKPIRFDQLSKGLRKASEILGKREGARTGQRWNFRIINSKGGVTGEFIVLPEIDYLKQDGNYTEIHLGKSRKIIVSSLSRTLKNLDFIDLVQIHKSYAVNLSKVKEIQFTELVLYSGIKIPIGRVYREKLKNLLGGNLL